MNKQANVPRGGGVVISPSVKKVSVVLTKDGQEIPVSSPQERERIIKELLGR